MNTNASDSKTSNKLTAEGNMHIHVSACTYTIIMTFPVHDRTTTGIGSMTKSRDADRVKAAKKRFNKIARVTAVNRRTYSLYMYAFCNAKQLYIKTLSGNGGSGHRLLSRGRKHLSFIVGCTILQVQSLVCFCIPVTTYELSELSLVSWSKTRGEVLLSYWYMHVCDLYN